MAVNVNGGQVQFSAVIDTDEFDSGLQKIGGSLSTMGKVAGAAALAVTATVGAAVSGVVAASVKSYSQYEQMVGGIETLYKESADQVGQYALSAMASSGLTANQYMETLTSFSGTLLRGLEGDTAKAATVGNMAVNNMADNAATFGTSMDTIRDTYQSLARGNFEMLDSLNLGFAGTQQGMADLINQSGVMGAGFVATAENVKSIPFDKMLSAIDAVQGQMGLTGRAAEEAMKTISGSMGMVTASWGNLLTAFGTGNTEMITQSFDTLVKGIVALATNVTAIIPNIINGITQIITVLPTAIAQILPIIVPAINQILSLIIGLIPQVIPVLVNVLMSLVNVIIQNLPAFLNAAVQLIMAIVQGIAKQAPVLLPQIIGVLAGLIRTILDNLPAFLVAAVQIVVALVNGIAQQAPTLIPQIITAIVAMLNALLQQLPLLIQAGIQLLIAVVKGLATALPQLISYIPQIINTLVTELTKPPVLSQLIMAALVIILAVARGLIQAIPQLIAAIPQIISSIIQAFRNIGASADEVGVNLMKGIWSGIGRMKDWLLGQIKGMAGSITNGIKSFFGIKSPSTLFRDEIGKNLALGLGEGFVDTMGDVSKQMNMSVPVSDFDINGVGNGSYSSNTQPTQPAQINVHIGEDRIASLMVDLINERSRLQGANAIFV